MDLYFLRHAKAVPRSGRTPHRDAERALAREGEEKMRAVAKGMQNLGLRFDRIVSSPYVRARQTAEIAAEVLKLTSKLVLSAHLAPDGDVKALLTELNQQRGSLGSVLLVGHEPYLSNLISTLTGGGRLRLALKKASLALVTTDALRHGSCATFQWLLWPRHLVLLSEV